MFVGKLDYSVGRGLWYAVEGGLYVYMSGITLTLAFFSSSAAVVTMSVTLANYCLMKIHRPLDSIRQLSWCHQSYKLLRMHWSVEVIPVFRLGQDQVEEICGCFCSVTWTDLSELAKLIEQLVTAEGGVLPPAFFPLLAVTTAWSLNMAIQKKKKIQLKKLIFCKPVEMSHVEKELDECSAGGRDREELLRRNRDTFLLVMSCQVGWAVLCNCTVAASQEVGAFA